MVSDGVPSPPETSGRPFTLSAFRGLRFDAGTVGDLGTVISPPYDVLDAGLPRKSTSFAPKPAMGVVMRDLHDA